MNVIRKLTVSIICLLSTICLAEDSVKIGGFDKTFKAHSIVGSVKCVAVLENDNVVVGGSISKIDGISVTSLVGLEKDGLVKRPYEFNLRYGSGQISSIFPLPQNSFFTAFNESYDAIVLFGEDNIGTSLPIPRYGQNEVSAIVANEKNIFVATNRVGYSKKNGKIRSRGRIYRCSYNGDLYGQFGMPPVTVNGGISTLQLFDNALYVGGLFRGISVNEEVSVNSVGGETSNTQNSDPFASNTNALHTSKDPFASAGKSHTSFQKANIDPFADNTKNINTKRYIRSHAGSINLAKFSLIDGGNLLKVENFSTKCGTDGEIMKVVKQAPDKLLLAGNFTSFGRKGSFIKTGGFIRIDENTAELDKSFNVTRKYVNGKVNDVLIHPKDGKIIIVGDFTKVGGVKCNRVARLNPDGTVDPTFDSKIGADQEVLSVAVQKSGNIIIGGSFRTYDGVKCDGLARINY